MNTIDTTVLVNPHRIRDSILRLFDGTPARIIGELLQNAQRATASSVTIATNPSGFSYEDNGHGIEGINGFHKLLCLGDSNFSLQVEIDQSPMGLGFASLLANEHVESVKIQSGNLSLSIDCQRWWHDIDYYSTWANRLEQGNQEDGFKVEVSCHPKFTKLVGSCLPSEIPSIRSWQWEPEIQHYPALGYQDLLKVELNGQDVYVGLPYGFQEAEFVTRFEWSGAEVKVYNPPGRNRKLQIINWYGQLIPASMEMPFGFLVVVRSGSPLTPKAPVRDSLVENEAKANLRQAIADAVFQELCSLNSSKITVDNISALYSLDFERAGRECPYFLASAYQSYSSGQNSEEIDNTSASCVYQYDNPPVLIDGKLKIMFSDHSNKISEYRYGLSSFVDCLKASGINPCSLNAGASNQRRLNVQDLYWQPGTFKTEANQRIYTTWFYGRGWWAVGQEAEIDTLSWALVTTDVFAFNESSTCSVDEVDWVIGTTEELPIDTLQEFYMAGFDPDSDYSDYDTRVSEYEDSLDGKVRLLMNDAVARDADYATLLEYASRKTGQPENRITHLKAEFNIVGEYKLLTSITLLGRTPLGEFKLMAKIYG